MSASASSSRTGTYVVPRLTPQQCTLHCVLHSAAHDAVHNAVRSVAHGAPVSCPRRPPTAPFGRRLRCRAGACTTSRRRRRPALRSMSVDPSRPACLPRGSARPAPCACCTAADAATKRPQLQPRPRPRPRPADRGAAARPRAVCRPARTQRLGAPPLAQGCSSLEHMGCSLQHIEL